MFTLKITKKSFVNKNGETITYNSYSVETPIGEFDIKLDYNSSKLLTGVLSACEKIEGKEELY